MGVSNLTCSDRNGMRLLPAFYQITFEKESRLCPRVVVPVTTTPHRPRFIYLGVFFFFFIQTSYFRSASNKRKSLNKWKQIEFLPDFSWLVKFTVCFLAGLVVVVEVVDRCTTQQQQGFTQYEEEISSVAESQSVVVAQLPPAAISKFHRQQSRRSKPIKSQIFV